MLLYLDNLANNCQLPTDVAQENYAREILELYAMGVDNRYEQIDIEDLIDDDDLAWFFPEMRPFVESCKFRLDCGHDEEPGCAVRRAVVEVGFLHNVELQPYDVDVGGEYAIWGECETWDGLDGDDTDNQGDWP